MSWHNRPGQHHGGRKAMSADAEAASDQRQAAAEKAKRAAARTGKHAPPHTSTRTVNPKKPPKTTNFMRHVHKLKRKGVIHREKHIHF